MISGAVCDRTGANNLKMEPNPVIRKTTDTRPLTEQVLRIHDMEQQEYYIQKIMQGEVTDHLQDVAVERGTLNDSGSGAEQTETQAWVQNQATVSHLNIPTMGRMVQMDTMTTGTPFFNVSSNLNMPPNFEMASNKLKMPVNFCCFQNIPVMMPVAMTTQSMPVQIMQTQGTTIANIRDPGPSYCHSQTGETICCFKQSKVTCTLCCLCYIITVYLYCYFMFVFAGV